jgi:hypothetical protein
MKESPRPETGVGVDDPQVDNPLPVGKLPLHEWDVHHCPAVPYWTDANGDPDLTHVQKTVEGLAQRGLQADPAYEALRQIPYTIENQTYSAYDFLYGVPPANGSAINPPGAPSPPNELALDAPDQFTLPWTPYGGVYDSSRDLIPIFSRWLENTETGKKEATENFWPTIANFGLPYNLLILRKVRREDCAALAAEFGDAWVAQDMAALQAAGRLYEIDMTILGSLKPVTARDGTVRFTPGTRTLLEQNPESKALTPIAIRVSTAGGPTEIYVADNHAWLYALQAAKTSITVYGVWLGHVYHLHIVTAAMQMAMYNRLPDDHPLWPLLRPQSQSLIDFDYAAFTILFGAIAPPTPLDGYMPILRLCDRFAKQVDFCDNNPPTALKRLGLEKQDFTVNERWDAYPVVRFLVDIWNYTHEYVTAVVHDIYRSDTEVATDGRLGAWMDASSDPAQGNIRGFPEVRTRDALVDVLTSLLHRVTVHGAGSLSPSVNPALAFVANFPPCLQSAHIPKPNDHLTTEQLVKLLPHTGTVGKMTTFYYTFIHSAPYMSFIPSQGITADPYFPGPPGNPCNQALFRYRARIRAFVDDYVAAWDTALAGLRGGDPGTPAYAMDLYQQWPSSIEL